MFVPEDLTIPLAVIIPVLIFGLTRYYTSSTNYGSSHYSNRWSRDGANTFTYTDRTNHSEHLKNTNDLESERHVLQKPDKKKKSDDYKKSETGKSNNTISISSNLFFVVGYAACILIVAAYLFIVKPSNEEIFVPWTQFTILQLIELGASIAICFFLPGYAIVSILHRDSDHQMKPLLKILLAYLLSVLITGSIGYVAASVGFGMSVIAGLLIFVYLFILLILLVQLSLKYKSQYGQDYFFRNTYSKVHTSELLKSLYNFLKKNSAESIVFASLFALIVLSTYYLYSGVIIGDQWYHHGRSLAFMSGEFGDISASGADDRTFSPFPSALLGAFFSVSGFPSVNAYASISFLNIIPVFAFYYFFKCWVPNNMKRAALLACTLLMLSSGFGWVYVLYLAATNLPETQISTLQMLYEAGIKSLDIILPTSFVSTAHPDYSTPLVLLALPAGFTLLGLIREKVTKARLKFRLKYLAILLSITILGILSHDEFYLFVIVASIIPVLWLFTESGSKNKKNFVVVYVALLAALLAVISAGFSLAGGYFIYNTILGFPVIVLSFIFVAITFILYIAIGFLYTPSYRKQAWRSRLHFKSPLLGRLKGSLYDNRRRTIAPSLLLVFIIAWLYAISFIVWSELSVEDVEVQTFDYTIPWYLYPMKLGVVGLLGFAFIVSYLFRKFEKEIFVFGIIVVVAFVTGPYYDEHRFSKYMMAGLAGFASLFIFSILSRYTRIQRKGRLGILATSLTLGVVILSSSLSILFFWGYNASAHEAEFYRELGRRDFPSASTLDLYYFLRSGIRDPLAFNVAAPSNEYALHTGDLIGKVHAFTGIPWTKLTQSPLTLNASTLEGFYDLLHSSDTHYIVLPKDDFASLMTEDATSPTVGVLTFAIENFQKVYEDGKYVMLAVPQLSPPQSQANIGLVIPKSTLSASSSLAVTDSEVLPYDNSSFGEIDEFAKSSMIAINETNSILYGDKGETTTLWSNPEEKHANYIKAVFRVMGENKTSNDSGIMWNDGSKEYTVSVRNDRLEVLEKSVNVTNPEPLDATLINVREFKRENGVWYTLEIMIADNSVNVYVNDILAIQAPRLNVQSDIKSEQQLVGTATTAGNGTGINSTIARMGLFSFNNIAEFKPIEIGKVPFELEEIKRIYFEHYYPLNMLALSKLDYDVFMEGDLSVFSKNVVVLDENSFPRSNHRLHDNSSLTLTPRPEGGNPHIQNNNNTLDKYLSFVKEGGTLIVMNVVNPSNKFEDDLQSRGSDDLFSIQPRDEVKFDRVGYNESEEASTKKKGEDTQGSYLDISGLAQNMEIKRGSTTLSDLKVISSYIDNGTKVTPFALEKKYGSGRIIIVNSWGYFDSIASSPKQYFQTLGEIPRMIGLEAVQQQKGSVTEISRFNNSMPLTRVVGPLNISGDSVINSSSLSILSNENLHAGVYNFDNAVFHVRNIESEGLSDIGGDRRSTKYDSPNDNYTIHNAIVRDLKLSGKYNAIISLNGSLVLPSMLASYYDYVAASISAGSNMTVKLHEGARAEFIVENGQYSRPVRFTDSGEINFYEVRNPENKNEMNVLLKSPEIRVINGKINFEKLYSSKPTADGGGLEAIGSMVTRFDHVDNYYEIDSKGGWTNTEYLSYLKSIQFGKYDNRDDFYDLVNKINIELPADISELAKEEGITVPWQSALLSGTNILTSLSIIAVAAATITILRRPRRLVPK